MKRAGLSTTGIMAVLALILGAACGEEAGKGPSADPVAATILGFEATPPTLPEPGTVTLSWTVEDAVEVILEQDDVEVGRWGRRSDPGSVELEIQESATFVLIARGRIGEPATRTLEVLVGLAPEIASFEATPEVEADEDGIAKVILSWTGVTGADGAWIEWGGGAPTPIEPTALPDGEVEVEVEVEETTTFTLVARNLLGETTATATTQVIPWPRILSFAADRSWVGNGEEVTVSWTTSGASSVELYRDEERIKEVEAGSLSGAYVFPAFFDSRLELRALNSRGTEDRQELEIIVAQPEIVRFEASVDRLWLGETLELEWEVQGASVVTLGTSDSAEPICEITDPAQLERASCSWTPTAMGEYDLILSASNGSGVNSETLTIPVGSGPAIDEFEIRPVDLSPGETIEVFWAVSPDPGGVVPDLTLEDDRGTSYPISGAEGRAEFTLTEIGSYVFTLKAETSHPLSTPAYAHIDVRVHGVPTVQLTASPSHFDDSQVDEVVLEWETESASRLVIYLLEDGEFVEIFEVDEAEVASGSHSVVPVEDSIYRIVATNAAGLSQEQSVEVTVAPIGILDFTADPLEVVAGEPVLLSWNTRMAPDVSLSIFERSYVREETTEPYLDVQEMGGIHLPLGFDCTQLAPACAIFEFPPGFTFPFDGEEREAILVHRGGFLGFDLENLPSVTTNNRFPTSSDFAHIAPFWVPMGWDDEAFPTGNMYWMLMSGPEGRALVFQWKSAVFTSSQAGRSADLNMNVLLWEDGRFEFRYGRMNPGLVSRDWVNGINATVGFQFPSREDWDVRLHRENVVLRGALAGRTFLYTPTYELPKKGSFLWHPFSYEDTISATLRIQKGEEVATRDVTVRVHRRPEIFVTRSPEEPVTTGTEFRIGWESYFSDSLELLDDRGRVRCTATAKVDLESGFCLLREDDERVHTYRLRVVGTHGFEAEDSVSVRTYHPFGITSFTSSAPVVDFGASVTLNWETFNAATIELFANGTNLLPTGAPTGPGSLTVPQLEEGTEFVLRVSNLAGDVVEKSLQVETWRVTLSASANATSVRPGEPLEVTLAASAVEGGPAPTIFGTFPMVETMEQVSKFEDISNHPRANVIAIAPNATSSIEDVAFPPGFTFPYFGHVFDSVRVFVDGFVSFEPSATATISNRPFPTDNPITNRNVHIAPFWVDLHPRNIGGIWYVDLDADTFVIQWGLMSTTRGTTNTATLNLNFQLVLLSNGSFEFRYGTMQGHEPPNTNAACQPNTCENEANGSIATIGYQAIGADAGFTIHHGGTGNDPANRPMEGGLSNRSWRYDPVPGGGVVTLHPTETKRLKFCANSGKDALCRTMDVEAEFGLDSFTASASSVAPGEPVTLSWRSHGGLELRILANDQVIYQAPTLQAVDEGALVVHPASHTSYTLEVKALGHEASSSRQVRVERIELAASAPATSFPGDPNTLSWTLTNRDPGLTPVLIVPLEEDAALPFASLDLAGDATATELIGPGNDAKTALLSFAEGFTFDYLGTPMDRVQVSSEGYLSFDLSEEAAQSSNQIIPSEDEGSRRIHLAPFWDDLHTRQSGRVLAKQVGPDTYVIQWSKVSVAAGSTDETEYDLNFMVVLHRSGDFEFRYGRMAPPATGAPTCQPISCANEANGSSATIGFQDPTGRLGHLLHHASAASEQRPVPRGLSNRSWRFVRYTSSGTIQVSPWDPTRYEICALDPGNGDVFCSAPVEIGAEWGIRSFGASPWAIKRTEELTLSWEVVGLDRLRLLQDGIELVRYEGDSIPAVGSMKATIAARSTFTLEATSLGRTVSVDREVALRAFDLHIEVPAERQVPGSEVSITWTADIYEPGKMFVTSPMSELPPGPSGENLFQDISVEPGAVELTMSSGSNGHAPVDLPFPFPYFGESYEGLNVYIDGYLSFEPTTANGVGTNLPFPTDAGNNWRVHLAPFWEDLQVREHDSIWAYQRDPDTFIIQWKNFNRYLIAAPGNYDLNFQVVLYSNGAFEYRYGRMDPPPPPFTNFTCYFQTCEAEANGASATIGYQTVDGSFGQNVHVGGNNAAEARIFPGGLSFRTFRFEPHFSGIARIVVGHTKEYEICGIMGDFSECKKVEIRPTADPGDLMITELMLDPPGGTAQQWFEVRNLRKEPLDLNGFEITSKFGIHRISESVVLQPGEFAVLTGAGLGSGDYNFGASLPLDPLADVLAISAGTEVIASVTWNIDWTVPRGQALSLDPSYHLLGRISNDDFGRWCVAGDVGSPGWLGGGCRSSVYDVDPSSNKAFIDISTTGTPLPSLATPNMIAQVPVSGFRMPFFGTEVEAVWASGNGWISFSDFAPSGGTAAPAVTALPRAPGAEPVGPLIAAFWGPLRCDPTTRDCSFRYLQTRHDGADVLILQWTRFQWDTAPGELTVQIQLWEDGSVVVAFGDMISWDLPWSVGWKYYLGSTAMVGIEGPNPADFLVGHHRVLLDLDHRSFHFIPR